MPVYVYECAGEHVFEVALLFAEHAATQRCACGRWAAQVITAPILVSGTANVCYDSPIDGRAITSMDAHREDMARNNCQLYDPEMKTDSLRRVKEADAKIEQHLDDTVERVYAKMPAQTRAKLSKEMQAGITAEPIRSTIV